MIIGNIIMGTGNIGNIIMGTGNIIIYYGNQKNINKSFLKPDGSPDFFLSLTPSGAPERPKTTKLLPQTSKSGN